MANELSSYVNSRNQAGLEISKTVDLFRRYACMEHSCVRALAGWFLKVPSWEAKIRLGYQLFAHAERANELYARLDELRGGNRDANLEPALNRLAEEIVNAPDGESFIAGLSLLLHHMAEAYREHLSAADSSANAMEIRVLQRLLPDVEREISEIAKLEHNSNRDCSPNAKLWTDYISSLIHAAGGISGFGPKGSALSPRPDEARFEWPTAMAFDDRLHHADLGTYESKMSLPLRERCIGEFEVYFNELYAAAILATVIYESWKISAPRQYFLDIAHHFWDEVRHAEFGALRLREHGIEPSKVNMMLFEQSQAMPFLHRFCHLTLGLEIFFMPRKPERVRYYEEQGDLRSQLFADVDWSEEKNHVRYGKRWVDHFLEEDARTLTDLQMEISNYLEVFASQMPEGRKAPW
ncbi:MAG: hypothetical protein K0Q81_251 [Paenibacillus sp.]|nr:hypothetical protein [Paenibacillus sp.]